MLVFGTLGVGKQQNVQTTQRCLNLAFSCTNSFFCVVWCSVSSFRMTTETIVANVTKDKRELMSGMGGGIGRHLVVCTAKGQMVVFDCPQRFHFRRKLRHHDGFTHIPLNEFVLRIELWVCIEEIIDKYCCPCQHCLDRGQRRSSDCIREHL